MNTFKGKVSIVTGGASGIGRALCKELARKGAVVAVADINLEGATQVAMAINEEGGHALAAHLDVCCAEDVESLIEKIVNDFGRIDYMFNNAGTNIAGEARDLSFEHWHRVVDTNLWGVIHGTSAAYKQMVKQGFGHIVNTASLAGLTGLPMNAAYSATKHAVVGLSNSIRVEAVGLGVNITVVCPAFIQTNGLESVTVINASRNDLTGNIPLKPMRPERAAQRILRGVAANRGMVVFPPYARLVWWLTRLNGALLVPVGLKTVERFRASRADS
jgi:NAD(P)-dependent dehydrogenase (short-subunit alcohol dehydrogenase family)